MVLATNKELLEKAKIGRYAVGQFNFNNMEFLQGIISAAEEKNSPAILATSEGAIKYATMQYIQDMAINAASKSKVKLSIHLDHGRDLELVKKCIESGYTSIMYDGSYLPYEENVKITKQVVEWAHAKGISVEGELGKLAGVEDNVAENDSVYTHPDQALDFVIRTGVDSLAVAIGTSHGAYKFKGESKLDFERLKIIASKVSVPLVLHGASGVIREIVENAKKHGAVLEDARGVSDEHIKTAVSLGVCKVNIDTDLRLAFMAGVREVLDTKKGEIDPRNYLGAGKEAIKKVVLHKIGLMGSEGKGLD